MILGILYQKITSFDNNVIKHHYVRSYPIMKRMFLCWCLLTQVRKIHFFSLSLGSYYSLFTSWIILIISRFMNCAWHWDMSLVFGRTFVKNFLSAFLNSLYQFGFQCVSKIKVSSHPLDQASRFYVFLQRSSWYRDLAVFCVIYPEN